MDGSPPLTEVDSSLPIPLYHQIYLGLKKRIQDGLYPYDTTLPGEKELCSQLNVSRITVKRALSELATEGFVSRHRGRGTVVRYRVPSPVVRADFEGLMENLIDMGVKTQIEVLKVKTIPAEKPIAEALECTEGDRVQFAIRRRLIEHEPFSLLHTYIPDEIAKKFPPNALKKTPILRLLADVGATPHRARQTITAVSADADIAEGLKLTVGAPVLKITRTIKSEDGRVVQHIVAYYRPDRYEYEMKLNSLKPEELSV